MLDNVGLRYPHRASGAKAPSTLRPLPLLRFAISATGGAHLCSIQYYLRFWLGICRTSLAVSALRIMRYCPKLQVFSKTFDLFASKPLHRLPRTAAKGVPGSFYFENSGLWLFSLLAVPNIQDAAGIKKLSAVFRHMMVPFLPIPLHRSPLPCLFVRGKTKAAACWQPPGVVVLCCNIFGLIFPVCLPA